MSGNCAGTVGNVSVKRSTGKMPRAVIRPNWPASEKSSGAVNSTRFRVTSGWIAAKQVASVPPMQ